MTTSIYNASAETLTPGEALPEQEAPPAPKTEARAEIRRTWAGRSVFALLSVAIVLTTLAYGTVHTWAFAIFQGSAALIVVLWAVDAWRSKALRISRNPLQLPLVALLMIGIIQLLPLGASGTGSGDGGALSLPTIRSLSLNPYATRLVLIQIVSLLIYFAATLAFTDSPRRLRSLVRNVTIFGFMLALFGLIQNFTSPSKIYWIREQPASMPFGPFVNRHHFAGYMELALALPLGLLFSGAVERDKRLLYWFAVAIMGIALIMTNSRGGIISLVAEVCFLVAVSGFGRKEATGEEGAKGGRARAAVVRVGLALGLVIALFVGVVLLGGESGLSRFVGTVSAEDPTTGRAHFWSTTLNIIRDHPLMGAGLGAFSLAYTRYDTRNGFWRIEQAHNDYLQVLADTGLVGAIFGLFFIVALFRMGFQRRETDDLFRRGVAIGALAGCFAVLVHSFFDFTLHTTSNALLFLVLASVATVNGRVEQANTGKSRKRRTRRRRRSHPSMQAGSGSSDSSPLTEGQESSAVESQAQVK